MARARMTVAEIPVQLSLSELDFKLRVSCSEVFQQPRPFFPQSDQQNCVSCQDIPTSHQLRPNIRDGCRVEPGKVEMRSEQSREYLIVELIIDKLSFEVENTLADHVPKDVIIILVTRLLASSKVGHVPAVIAGKVAAAVLAEGRASPYSAGGQWGFEGEAGVGFTVRHV